jgi:L-malate glycosyltransferase
MQIGFISTLDGGIGRTTSNLIKGLIRNHDIGIQLFLVDSLVRYELAVNNNVTQRYIPKLKPLMLSKIEALLNLSLKVFPVDIVHCHYASNAAFLKRYKGHLILTMHGFPRPEIETSVLDKLAYIFEQWSLSYIPKKVEIVTISQYCRENIKERYGLEAKVIYNGVDCNFYTPCNSRDILKRNMGFETKKVLLFVGRLHPIKDPITLVKAYYEVSKRISDVMLVIVGRGPLKGRIEKLSSEYGISIKIIEGSYGTELLSLYQCADLFILPSLGESFGLVLAEAMACGCPCLANTSGASPEILGMKDLLVEPQNPKDLAERIIYLLQNSNQAKNVSEYLHTRVNSLFSVGKMVKEYYKLYTRALTC